MKKIQVLLWEVGKLYEIPIFESINKDILEHSHAHLFFLLSILNYNEELQQRLYGLQKLNCFYKKKFYLFYFIFLLFVRGHSSFLILILWEIFDKPHGYNWEHQKVILIYKHANEFCQVKRNSPHFFFWPLFAHSFYTSCSVSCLELLWNGFNAWQVPFINNELTVVFNTCSFLYLYERCDFNFSGKMILQTLPIAVKYLILVFRAPDFTAFWWKTFKMA